jgi:hypothetical protein
MVLLRRQKETPTASNEDGRQQNNEYPQKNSALRFGIFGGSYFGLTDRQYLVAATARDLSAFSLGNREGGGKEKRG